MRTITVHVCVMGSATVTLDTGRKNFAPIHIEKPNRDSAMRIAFTLCRECGINTLEERRIHDVPPYVDRLDVDHIPTKKKKVV